jgi:light-regulated signal transduction histidine kinase (bacteriophytochrome)
MKLAIIHCMISLHGGQVQTEGSISEGTTCYFPLPVEGKAQMGIEGIKT